MVAAEYFSNTVHSCAGHEDIHEAYVGQIILQPNNSLSWQATGYFLCTLAMLSLTMACLFLAKGYWLILPFTVLELSILAGCFYYILRRNQIQQVVRFGAHEVVVEIGRRAPESSRKWQRFFTKVMVHTPRHPWYSNRIALRCRDEEVEIGQFLTATDKALLITEMRQMIAAADNLMRSPPAAR